MNATFTAMFLSKYKPQSPFCTEVKLLQFKVHCFVCYVLLKFVPFALLSFFFFFTFNCFNFILIAFPVSKMVVYKLSCFFFLFLSVITGEQKSFIKDKDLDQWKPFHYLVFGHNIHLILSGLTVMNILQ